MTNLKTIINTGFLGNNILIDKKYIETTVDTNIANIVAKVPPQPESKIKVRLLMVSDDQSQMATQFLDKIANSVKLSVKEFAIVNYKHIDKYLADYIIFFDDKILIEPFKSEVTTRFVLTIIGHQKVVLAEKVILMQDNRELKLNLWQCLKQLFNL